MENDEIKLEPTPVQEIPSADMTSSLAPITGAKPQLTEREMQQFKSQQKAYVTALGDDTKVLRAQIDFWEARLKKFELVERARELNLLVDET